MTEDKRTQKRLSSIAVICNSTNSDLVAYFRRDLETYREMELGDRLVVLRNSGIGEVPRVGKQFTGSFSRKAFLDPLALLDLALSPYLLWQMARCRVRVMHFTTAHLANLFLAIPAKLLGIRLFFTIHDLTPHPGLKSRFIAAYNRLVTGWLADRIVAFSRQAARDSRVPHKFFLMPLGGFETAVNLPKAGTKILFFGRIDKYKGVGNFLSLAQLALEKNMNLEFILAGKGNIPELRELMALPNMTVLNRHIEEREVAGLFREAMFVVLPYDSATQSGVALLAYAHATPVIAYDVGSLHEYIQHGITGFLVRHGDNRAVLDIIRETGRERLLELSSNVIDCFGKNYSKRATKLEQERFVREELLPLLGD